MPKIPSPYHRKTFSCLPLLLGFAMSTPMLPLTSAWATENAIDEAISAMAPTPDIDLPSTEPEAPEGSDKSSGLTSPKDGEDEPSNDDVPTKRPAPTLHSSMSWTDDAPPVPYLDGSILISNTAQLRLIGTDRPLTSTDLN